MAVSRNINVSTRRATICDLEYLVKSRLDFIQITTANPKYEFIKDNISQYFIGALNENACDIILAEQGCKIIATGIIFYYDSVPSLKNPRGKNAYITSMFVEEEYRCHGIGTTILDELVNIGKLKGYDTFILQASEQGRPLYERYGFADGNAPMILSLGTTKMKQEL